MWSIVKTSKFQQTVIFSSVLNITRIQVTKSCCLESDRPNIVLPGISHHVMNAYMGSGGKVPLTSSMNEQYKLSCYLPNWHRGEVEVQFYPYSLSALEGVGCQRHYLTVLPPRNKARTPYTEGYLGLRTGLDASGKSGLQRGSNPKQFSP
jgi:hypothetical protein